MSKSKIEQIIGVLYEPEEVAAWFLIEVEDKFEEAGYHLTRSGRLQLRSAITEMAEGYGETVVEEIGHSLDMSGFPSSDEEAEEILEFLQSDAGETFQRFFRNRAFKWAAMRMRDRLHGNDYLQEEMPLSEVIDRMEEAEPHWMFGEDETINADDPFFEEE